MVFNLSTNNEHGFYACFYCANSHQFLPDAANQCKCVCHEAESAEKKAKNEEWRIIAASQREAERSSK